jgi:hypothetical protein
VGEQAASRLGNRQLCLLLISNYVNPQADLCLFRLPVGLPVFEFYYENANSCHNHKSHLGSAERDYGIVFETENGVVIGI